MERLPTAITVDATTSWLTILTAENCYATAVDMDELTRRIKESVKTDIAAKGLEIRGVGAAGNFFFGVAAFVKRGWIVGAILMLLIPVAVIGGLSTPALANWLLTGGMKDPSARVMLAIMMYALLFGLTFGFGFLPTMIAGARHHSKTWVIFGLTFVSWIVPMGWPALVLFAYWDPESNVGGAEKT